MNKPTDEELNILAWTACGPLAFTSQTAPEDVRAELERRSVVFNRALHDAGLAHGWREAIEELRERAPLAYARGFAASGDAYVSAAAYLERIAKERGL
jgi:hypothetical protein